MGEQGAWPLVFNDSQLRSALKIRTLSEFAILGSHTTSFRFWRPQVELDQRIRDRAVALVDKGHAVLATHRPSSGIGFPTLNRQSYANWQSQSLSFLMDLLGPEHVYTLEFQEKTKKSGYIATAEASIGILQAVVEDIEQGYIATVRQLITAEVFSDLFEQATHLLDSGYKAPAASLAGAVLENGLRSISSHNQVSVRAKDDLSALNQKLASKGIYSRLVQKKVSVWTDIRNSADHGQFEAFEDDDVKDLIRGAQSLLVDYL